MTQSMVATVPTATTPAARTPPRRAPSAFGAFLRLELADALRSRWLVFTTASYLGVLGLFGWLGLRESSVLGFTGM